MLNIKITFNPLRKGDNYQ